MTARPTIAEIQARVCERFGVSREEIVGPSRLRRIVRPRQVAMALAVLRRRRSLHQVGRAFNRDHTTVIHARRQIKLLRATDARLDADVRALKREFGRRQVAERQRLSQLSVEKSPKSFGAQTEAGA